MSGLSRLGIALTVIFAISLVVLFAELFYLLWRRPVFGRRTSTSSGGGDEASDSSSSECTFPSASFPKELLYFFCMRPQSRLQHNLEPADTAIDPNSNQQSDMEVIDIDLLKIQGMFGPPRFLFTITEEEEREGLESPAEKSMCPVAEKEVKKKMIEDQIRSRVSLEDCFIAAGEAVVEVEIGDGGVDDSTPFSTPCASPMYFTPSASPAQDDVVVSGGWSPKNS